MKVLIINSSAPTYNLATEKMMTKYSQECHDVSYVPAFKDNLQYDLALLSAIFTWDLPKVVRDVKLIQESSPSATIEIGGPASTAMAEFVYKETKIRPHCGIDDRFEHIAGDFKATFTSRGCPRSCSFCVVPTLEGPKIVEYDNFNIPIGKKPFICDNNILSTSREHQYLVVEKCINVKNLDINSGFDVRIFMKDPEYYYRLYSQLQLSDWRFAYDKPEQNVPITQCVDFLHKKGVTYRNILVYALVGLPDTTFRECQEKLQYLVDIGCSPYPQRYRPLDTLNRKHVPAGWQEQELELLFGYYGVPYIWRQCSWQDFLEELDTGALKKKKEEQFQAFSNDLKGELFKLLTSLFTKHNMKFKRERLLLTYESNGAVKVFSQRGKEKSKKLTERHLTSRSSFAEKWSFCDYTDLEATTTRFASPSKLAQMLGLKISGRDSMLDVFGAGKIMLDGTACNMGFEVEGDLLHKELGMRVRRLI